MPLSEDTHHLLVFIKALIAYIACTIAIAVCKELMSVETLRFAWASEALVAASVALHLMLGVAALVLLGVPVTSRVQYKVTGFLVGTGSMLTGVSMVLVELPIVSSALSILAWLSWASLILMFSGFVLLILSVYDVLRKRLSWLSSLLLVFVASWALFETAGLQGVSLLTKIFHAFAPRVSVSHVVCSIIGLVGWTAILKEMERN